MTTPVPLLLLAPVPVDIRPESLVLLETDEWLVGVPLTPWAAAWWGSFTQWCTAIDDGAFWSSHRQGPLIVFRHRVSSYRWQLHPVTGEFRDCRNRRASWRGFVGREPVLVAALASAFHAPLSERQGRLGR